VLANRLTLLVALAVVPTAVFAQDNKFNDGSKQRDASGGSVVYIPKCTQKICPFCAAARVEFRPLIGLRHTSKERLDGRIRTEGKEYAADS
jgi:hypothetical protein